jgi:tetrahydromethanopterin S-methyltransferase subunit B
VVAVVLKPFLAFWSPYNRVDVMILKINAIFGRKLSKIAQNCVHNIDPGKCWLNFHPNFNALSIVMFKETVVSKIRGLIETLRQCPCERKPLNFG